MDIFCLTQRCAGIDGNDDVRAHRFSLFNGQVLRQTAVNQYVPFIRERRKSTGNRHGRAHGIGQIDIFLHYYRFPVIQIRCDRRKGNR